MDIDRLRDFGIRRINVRRRFDTSHFFEEKMISGSNFTLIKFKDSITEWTIQAIGISEDDGPYIADSKDVKTFRDFFVQVDLPYKATRKEMFNVKVTVCNYMKTEQTARVYLKGVDKVCYGTTPGQNSPPQTLTLPPNSAKSLSFGAIALQEGNYPITVSALVVNDDQPYVDVLEKQLYVVNEGFQERKTITVCLDPANESQSCINSPGVTRHQPTFSRNRPSIMMTVELTLPESALRGSGSANAYLSTCSARNYIPEVDLETTIESGDGQRFIRYRISNQNTVLNALFPMKVPNGDKLKVTVTGVGTGILKIDLFYRRLANKEEICPFEISRIKIKEVITEIADNQEIRLLDTPRPCDVCGYCPESEPVHGNISLPRKRQKRQVQEERPHLKCVEFSVRTKSPSYEAGMAIVEVNLETGMSVVESDLKILQRNYTVFPLYEMPTDGKGFIIFYLSKVTSRPINIIFRLKDDFSGNEPTRQEASVRVYDYYNPEKSCITQYSINPNKAYPVAIPCEGGEQCKCVQSQCPQPVDDELFRMASALANEQNAVKKRTLPSPIDKLMEYACNFEKANYVVYVTIMAIANDTQRNVRFASSTVKNVLLQGGVNIQVDDEMDFEWQTDCAHPAFEVGKTYYVIGKDISRLIDGDVKSVRYDLMGTTLVINPMYEQLLVLYIVLNSYFLAMQFEYTKHISLMISSTKLYVCLPFCQTHTDRNILDALDILVI
ncbi:hypothetical protein DPMN_191533 [Dreissena polymorpha]|uniref:Uncharacterized protein n=1 Tax=Dreissena polymorpha TaxID=45954 RepID=A0A9D4BEW6_DREPO|nr:hypothetical protein DPMN_191533 [Dreissena polymorpha]